MANFTETTDDEGKSVYNWELAADRHYTLTSTTFTKRQLRPEERFTKDNGDIITPDYVPWSRERLENERDALLFIPRNTSILVPKFLDFSIQADVASITMEAVDGEMMEHLSPTLTQENRKTLERNVFSYINNTVLPQLRNLKSNTLGSVHGKIVPPYRLQDKDEKRTHWPSKTAPALDYVYCHNDLQQHNIVVNPETLQVVSIIDWEFSGFYPPEFEFPFWLTRRASRPIKRLDDPDEEDPALDNLIKLIDEPDANALIVRPWAAITTRLRAMFSPFFSWLANKGFIGISNIFSRIINHRF